MQEPDVELQTRLAFLEDTVTTLNDVVAAHEQTIERMERILGDVRAQLAAVVADGAEADDTPPHY